MKTPFVSSSLVGIAGLTLFTTLLVKGHIGEIAYVGLLVPLSLVCLTFLVLPRLRELDLRNLKLTLEELKQVKSEIETVKAEIEEMYGGIENLRRVPMVLDDRKMRELGLNANSLAAASSVMRYPVGCIKRERERLARIFVTSKSPEGLAEAILDNTLDDKVFKWNGPEVSLDEEPRPVDDRNLEKEESQE